MDYLAAIKNYTAGISLMMSGLKEKSQLIKHYCNRVQPRRGAQMGICNGVQSSGYPGNIRKKKKYI